MVPNWEAAERFFRDYRQLSTKERSLVRAARVKFVQDLERGAIRKGPRIKAVQGAECVYELTWAPDGRATFHFGSSLGRGAHVVWRRIGTHSIFDDP